MVNCNGGNAPAAIGSDVVELLTPSPTVVWNVLWLGPPASVAGAAASRPTPASRTPTRTRCAGDGRCMVVLLSAAAVPRLLPRQRRADRGRSPAARDACA